MAGGPGARVVTVNETILMPESHDPYQYEHHALARDTGNRFGVYGHRLLSIVFGLGAAGAAYETIETHNAVGRIGFFGAVCLCSAVVGSNALQANRASHILRESVPEKE